MYEAQVALSQRDQARCHHDAAVHRTQIAPNTDLEGLKFASPALALVALGLTTTHGISIQLVMGITLVKCLATT